MKIHRSNPDSNFAQVPNELLQDERLSYAARGLLVEILSRPGNWATSAEAIGRNARRVRGPDSEGIRTIKRHFAELRKYGYLRTQIVRGARGRISSELHFYDVPAARTDSAVTDCRLTDLSVTDAPVTDRSVTATSLKRQNTKTERKTGQKDVTDLSLGALLLKQHPLPELEAMTEHERESFASWIISSNQVARPLGFFKAISDSDVRYHLTEYRHVGAARPAPNRPVWCGNCDEATRMIETDGGRSAARCPACHPLAAGAVR